MPPRRQRRWMSCLRRRRAGCERGWNLEMVRRRKGVSVGAVTTTASRLTDGERSRDCRVACENRLGSRTRRSDAYSFLTRDRSRKHETGEKDEHDQASETLLSCPPTLREKSTVGMVKQCRCGGNKRDTPTRRRSQRSQRSTKEARKQENNRCEAVESNRGGDNRSLEKYVSVFPVICLSASLQAFWSAPAKMILFKKELT